MSRVVCDGIRHWTGQCMVGEVEGEDTGGFFTEKAMGLDLN